MLVNRVDKLIIVPTPLFGTQEYMLLSLYGILIAFYSYPIKIYIVLFVLLWECEKVMKLMKYCTSYMDQMIYTDVLARIHVTLYIFQKIWKCHNFLHRVNETRFCQAGFRNFLFIWTYL